MILSGTTLAAKLETELKMRIAARGVTPKLAVILAGTDPASAMYVSMKRAAAARIGVAYELHEETSATTESLIEVVQQLNQDATVHGILIQIPLPAGIDTDAVIAAMDPAKDVDGFHPKNIAAFMANDPAAHTPVLLSAVQLLLQETHQNFMGAHAVILGKSDIFLKPMGHLLEQLGMSVSWMKQNEFDAQKTAEADVLIVALGVPKIITAAAVKDGATIIDIGINRTPAGKVVGDVDFESVAPHAAWITPTPGGVGPMTIYSLFLTLAELSFQQPSF